MANFAGAQGEILQNSLEPIYKNNKKLPRNVLGVKIFDNRSLFQLQNLLLEIIFYENYSTTDVYQLKFILKVKLKIS